MDTFFAVTAPGLEAFTAEELRRLLPDQELVPEPGGVRFKGDLAVLQRANLQLRTASRVLARLGNFFYAKTFPELEQRAGRLPWERFLTPGQPIVLRVSCHRSRLYHSDAVARSLAAAVADRLGQVSPQLRPDDEAEQPPQLVIVRLADDRVTVSADSSGTLLHKRGYRQAVAKAPLRETLAAAVLMASGWDMRSPLLDPFCGSGTIPIEAGLMALGVPPGIQRRFAFMDWPGFDRQGWEAVKSASIHARPEAEPFARIQASDRDRGAVGMARANAERAGIAQRIEFDCLAISSINPAPGPGWVVTNPPYGLRVSAGRDLRDLYARFGDVLRRECPGWRLAVLCSDPILLGQLRLPLDTNLGLVNGGVRVRLGRGIIEP